MKLAMVVEGHGEVDAVPILVERILALRAPGAPVNVLRKPFRVPRGRMIAGDHLERAIQFQVGRVEDDGGILVFLDADDDCPAELGPRLLRRVVESSKLHRVGLVVAAREFESWLVAGTAPHGTPTDVDAEGLADPKGWLKSRLGAYSPTIDQPRLTARLDIAKAESLRSFRKLLREIHKVTGFDVERGPETSSV